MLATKSAQFERLEGSGALFLTETPRSHTVRRVVHSHLAPLAASSRRYTLKSDIKLMKKISCILSTQQPNRSSSRPRQVAAAMLPPLPAGYMPPLRLTDALLPLCSFLSPSLPAPRSRASRLVFAVFLLFFYHVWWVCKNATISRANFQTFPCATSTRLHVAESS